MMMSSVISRLWLDFKRVSTLEIGGVVFESFKQVGIMESPITIVLHYTMGNIGSSVFGAQCI